MDAKEILQLYRDNSIIFNDWNGTTSAAVQTLEALADRATPRSPIPDEEGGVFWSRCPCCGEQVMEPSNFCGECGQAIKWEDSDETD